MCDFKEYFRRTLMEFKCGEMCEKVMFSSVESLKSCVFENEPLVG